MFSNLNVRTETTGDHAPITNVHDRAFAGKGEGKLVSLLRDSEAFVPELSIVAEQSGKVVGHVLFSKISLLADGRDLNSLSLAPVAVLPELQRRGVGQTLIHEGIRRAKALGFSSILVLGDPAYYKRFGFRHELVASIACRYTCKHFAGVELTPHALSQITGASATYPAAFSAVD